MPPGLRNAPPLQATGHSLVASRPRQKTSALPATPRGEGGGEFLAFKCLPLYGLFGMICRLAGFGLYVVSGFFIWLSGYRLFGEVEPWDERAGNGMIYLGFSNAAVGAASGLVGGENRWLRVFGGLLLGQLAYLKCFADGPLMAVGVIYIVCWSGLAAGTHSIVRWVRRNTGSRVRG